MTGLDYGTELHLGLVSSGGVAVAQSILANIPEPAAQSHSSSVAHHWCLIYGTQSTRVCGGEL